MMKTIYLKIILVLLFIGCKIDDPSIEVVNKVFLENEVIGKDVQLVDVRTQEEYDSGHIGDAVNFNVVQGDIFLEQIKALDKSKPVYLYCKAGGRSNRAAQILKEQGFTKIFDYSGGYNDWILDQ